MLVPLTNLEILAIVDNELDPLSPTPACVEVSGRLNDVAQERGATVHDRNDKNTGTVVKELAMEQICCAAHGLSLMITGTSTNNIPQTLLFDTGPTASIFTANANRLNPPLHNISLIHLSHWHRDHSGGMLAAIKLINNAKTTHNPSHSHQVNVVVDLHPSRPIYRGVASPSHGIRSLEADPTFEEIEMTGGIVEKNSEPHEILDGFFLVSGEIPRETEYEKGIRRGVRYEGVERGWVDDELIRDERFVVCWVKDKGLVVFTGCSHAGVVNASRHAVALAQKYSDQHIPLYAVVGGYHLADADPATIKTTVQDLKALGVRVLIAGHCTGWRAKFEIEKEMPGCLVPSFVGIKTTI